MTSHARSLRSHAPVALSFLAVLLPWSAPTDAALIAAGSAPRPSSDPQRRADDLGQRLIRKAARNVDDDVMEKIIRAMNEAARRLEVDFDAGEETQSLQRRIVGQLDDAIKQAAMQRRRLRRAEPTASADKRRMPDRAQRRHAKRAKGSAQKRDASSTTGGKRDVSAEGGLPGGTLRESRRSWGSLPLRERDEVLQGIGEQFLERYRAWIERYYRSLQEAPE